MVVIYIIFQTFSFKVVMFSEFINNFSVQGYNDNPISNYTNQQQSNINLPLITQIYHSMHPLGPPLKYYKITKTIFLSFLPFCCSFFLSTSIKDSGHCMQMINFFPFLVLIPKGQLTLSDYWLRREHAPDEGETLLQFSPSAWFEILILTAHFSFQEILNICFRRKSRWGSYMSTHDTKTTQIQVLNPKTKEL